jgi:hypothetical protein
LLLLPRRLIQGVLGRPTACCWRAAQGIFGREFVPADYAEHSMLLPLRRCCSFLFSRMTPGKRCGSGRSGSGHLGVGVGTLCYAERHPIGCYTFGCHCFVI